MNIISLGWTELTGFGREYTYLMQHGYKYNTITKTMNREEWIMRSVWTKINDDIPEYMKIICEKYKLFCVKVSSIKTAPTAPFSLHVSLPILEI